MVTRLLAGQLKNLGWIPGWGNIIFFFKASNLAVNEVLLSVWVNRLGHEADLSCPSNAEIKNW
jgi:hypothetical protein